MEEMTSKPRQTETPKAQGRPPLGPRAIALAATLLGLFAGRAGAQHPLESASLELAAPLTSAAPRALDIAARHNLVGEREVWRSAPPSREWVWRGQPAEVEAAISELEALGEQRGKELVRRAGADPGPPARLRVTLTDSAEAADTPFGRRAADTLAASWGWLVALAQGVALVGVAVLPWAPALLIVALVLRVTLRRFARYLRRQIVWLFSPAKPVPPRSEPPGPGELFPGFPVR